MQELIAKRKKQRLKLQESYKGAQICTTIADRISKVRLLSIEEGLSFLELVINFTKISSH